MKWLYLVLGLLLSFNATLILVEPLQVEREKTIVKIQSLQSCYFSAVKFAKIDPDKSAEFCDKHSADTTANYSEIAQKMDEITDQQYTPRNYYGRKIKSWFGF